MAGNRLLSASKVAEAKEGFRLSRAGLEVLNERFGGWLSEVFGLAKYSCTQDGRKTLSAGDFETAFKRLQGKFISDYLKIEISSKKEKLKEVENAYEYAKENLGNNVPTAQEQGSKKTILD